MDNSNTPVPAISEVGKGPAIASLVLGIVGVVFWFLGWLSIVSVVCGIVGIILSVVSKKKGYRGGIKTAGLVLSIISLIFGSLIFVACIACAGVLTGSAIALGEAAETASTLA